MGGSGGFSGYKSIGISRLYANVSGSQSSQIEIEMNKFLEELLKEYNSRDVETIRTHLNEIEKALGKEIEGIEKILFGGSIAKSTFIEGTSDVDALVILDSSKYKNASPKDLQQEFLKMLRHRFPKTEIKCGALAVTVKFKDYEIQLLPAMKQNGKLKIANSDGNGWSASIDSSAFTKKLTAINQTNGNKVVPVIKLAKSLFNNLPSQYQLSGYHVEALAVEAFSVYNGRYTLYDMTKHMLDYSTRRVLNPMNDATGQSSEIDSNFGGRNSMIRQQLSHQIKNIAGKFSGATANAKELFE